jgi:hypothetical protein
MDDAPFAERQPAVRLDVVTPTPKAEERTTEAVFDVFASLENGYGRSLILERVTLFESVSESHSKPQAWSSYTPVMMSAPIRTPIRKTIGASVRLVA